MELTKKQKSLIAKVRKAIKYENEGSPMKDVIDDSDVIDALELLIYLVDSDNP